MCVSVYLATSTISYKKLATAANSLMLRLCGCEILGGATPPTKKSARLSVCDADIVIDCNFFLPLESFYVFLLPDDDRNFFLPLGLRVNEKKFEAIFE